MDPLDKIIDEKKAEVAQLEQYAAQPDFLRRVIEMKKTELGALVLAASLRPVASDGPEDEPEDQDGNIRGKPPGAISRVWRQVLADLYKTQKPFNADELSRVAKKHSIEIDPKAARARLKTFQTFEHVKQKEAYPPDTYMVTNKAAKRFGFPALSGDPKD